MLLKNINNNNNNNQWTEVIFIKTFNNNLSKSFIFFNNKTICHRIITEGFKTGVAQVIFLCEIYFFFQEKISAA